MQCTIRRQNENKDQAPCLDSRTLKFDMFRLWILFINLFKVLIRRKLEDEVEFCGVIFQQWLSCWRKLCGKIEDTG